MAMKHVSRISFQSGSTFPRTINLEEDQWKIQITWKILVHFENSISWGIQSPSSPLRAWLEGIRAFIKNFFRVFIIDLSSIEIKNNLTIMIKDKFGNWLEDQDNPDLDTISYNIRHVEILCPYWTCLILNSIPAKHPLKMDKKL